MWQTLTPMAISMVLRTLGTDPVDAAESPSFAQLSAADADDFTNFGRSIAVSGDTLVIGAYLDDDIASGAGSAYVFIKQDSTWLEQAKLVASDAESGDRFGGAVAIDAALELGKAFGAVVVEGEGIVGVGESAATCHPAKPTTSAGT